MTEVGVVGGSLGHEGVSTIGGEGGGGVGEWGGLIVGQGTKEEHVVW